jgi:hypothetical protein
MGLLFTVNGLRGAWWGLTGARSVERYISLAVAARGGGDRERLDDVGSSLTGDGEAVRWWHDGVEGSDFFHGGATLEGRVITVRGERETTIDFNGDSFGRRNIGGVCGARLVTGGDTQNT